MRWLLLLLLLAVPASGTIVTPEVVILDPTADIQEAIDGTADGDILRLGPGRFVAESATGWTIDHPITIEGAGIGSPDSAGWGTSLMPYGGDGVSTDSASVFTITSSGVYIRDLVIANDSTPGASTDSLKGNGILIDCTADTLRNIVLERVLITHMGGFGVAAFKSTHSVVDLHLIQTDLVGNAAGSTWNNANVDPRRWPCDFNGSDWYTPTTQVVAIP